MTSRIATLRRALGQLARSGIAVLPTPLEPAPRLARAMRLGNLHVKRDDLTGLAFGGNKTRQLDLILAAALRRGATAVVSQASPQSNQSRQLAAAAKRLGLELRLVSAGGRPSGSWANDLVCEVLGARIDYVPREADVMERIADVTRELERASHVVHLLDVVDHRTEDSCLGALGYIECACEILEQLGDSAVPSHVFVSCGTGPSPTLAGIVAGFAALRVGARVIGVPAAPQPPEVAEQTIDIAARALRALDDDTAIQTRHLEVDGEFAGLSYGATPDSLAAVRLAAHTEGLLCDPNYTGKALAAIVAHGKRNDATNDVVVFVHTGGLPLLFLPELQERLVHG